MTDDDIDRLVRQANPVPDVAAIERLGTSLDFDASDGEMQLRGPADVETARLGGRRRIVLAVAVVAVFAIGGVSAIALTNDDPLRKVSTQPVTCAPTVATLPVNSIAPDGSTPPAGNWSETPPNREPVSAETAADWQDRFEQALAEAEGPGAWIAIADPNLGYWVAAIGEAVAGETPATVEDHGRITEMTITFTATAVLEHVAAGNIALDDTVAALAPKLVERYPPLADITVEQLLSMTSGIPDNLYPTGGMLEQAAADPTRMWTAEEVVGVALEAGRTGVPGVGEYSPANYTILGIILETVTCQPIDVILTDVARRAGLADTGLLPAGANELPEPFSHGYIEAFTREFFLSLGVPVAAGTDVTDWSTSWRGAASGMHATIEDLFDWTAGGLGTNLLPEDLAAERLTLDNFLGGELMYGFGIEGRTTNDLIGHVGGRDFGWAAIGTYQAESGATFVAMTNGLSLDPFITAYLEITTVEL
jgi:D-alanyl-D-alanine carboxypeptidase